MVCYVTSVYIGTLDIFLNTGAEFLLPQQELTLISGSELYYILLYQLVYQSSIFILKMYIDFPSSI